MKKTEVRRIAAALTAELLSASLGLLDWEDPHNTPGTVTEDDVDAVRSEAYTITEALRRRGQKIQSAGRRP